MGYITYFSLRFLEGFSGEVAFRWRHKNEEHLAVRKQAWRQMSIWGRGTHGICKGPRRHRACTFQKVRGFGSGGWSFGGAMPCIALWAP